MNKTSLLLLAVIILGFHFVVGAMLYRVSQRVDAPQLQVPPLQQVQPTPPPAPAERKPQITETMPQGQLSYDGLMQWLDRLHAEAPDQTEVGLVGRSSSGREIKYIRVGPPNDGPKVLITACVHGNEKLCASVSLACISQLLKNYMVDEEVTELLRTRQLYYVPAVCPDGYVNNSRHEDGLDPNRNWSGRDLAEIQSIPSVQSMKDFFLKHKFKAAMSCHNYGRIYFIPWGYNQTKSEVFDDYKRILTKMCGESGYEWEQLLRQSAPPYYGYEADWYHKHGAFAFVNEIGHNFAARQPEIESETKANYKAFLIYIREAPLVMQDERALIQVIQ